MTETQRAQITEALAALGRSMAKAARGLNSLGREIRNAQAREARSRAAVRRGN